MVGYSAINRVGLSVAMPSLSAAALRAVPTDKLARGTSNASFFLTMGGGFGIALLTVFFQHRSRFHGEALAATQTSPNETTLELLGGIRRLPAASGMPDLTQATGALNYLSQMVLAQASTFAFKDTFLAIAVMSLLAVGPAPWRKAMVETLDAIRNLGHIFCNYHNPGRNLQWMSVS